MKLVGLRIGSGFAALLAACAFVLPIAFMPVLIDVFALPKTLVMLAISAALFVGLLVLVFRGGVRALTHQSGTTEALTLYLALTTAATIHSPDPMRSLVGQQLQYQGLLATFGYALAFLAARQSLTTEARVRRLLVVAISAAVLVALYGLLQQTGNDPIWLVLDKGRIFSTIGQANALGAYLVLALPMALTLAAVTRGRYRALALLGAAVIFAALALTLSRGAYLGATVALLVLAALVVRRSSLTRRRVALAGAALVVAVSVGSAAPPITNSIGRIVDRVGLTADLAEGSAASHLDLWAVGLRIALDHPLLGVGPETYPFLFAQYRDTVLPPARAAVMARFTPESPHDVPLAIADGAGIPALAAYLTLVLGALALAWRRLRQTSRGERLLLGGLVAAVAGHLVTDLFMTADVTGSWIAWVLLGALCATTSTQASMGDHPREPRAR